MFAVESLDVVKLADEDGLTFWKELIYVGQFEKTTDKDSMKFSVTEKDIDRWVETFSLFTERGISVPVPKDHDFDVEANRGLVTGMEKREDSHGRVGIFGKIQFRDAEAAKMAETAKVSIFIPPEFTDSQGNKYKRPIRHVALTDYPVINQLDGFIAASFSEGGGSMSIKKLATALGVKFEEDDSDDTVSAAIGTSFSSLKASLKEATGKIKAAEGDGGGGGGGGGGDGGGDNDTTTTAAPSEGVAAGFASPAMLSMLGENRNNKIDKLVTAGKITPAVAKDLSTQYCNDNSLKLSLTQENSNDGFDSVISALDKNDPVELGEMTGAQTDRALLSFKDGEKNPLIANAEKRAADAKAATG